MLDKKCRLSLWVNGYVTRGYDRNVERVKRVLQPYIQQVAFEELNCALYSLSLQDSATLGVNYLTVWPVFVHLGWRADGMSTSL